MPLGLSMQVWELCKPQNSAHVVPTSFHSTALSAFATSLNVGLVCRSYTYGHARGMLNVRSHPSAIPPVSSQLDKVMS